MKKNYRHHHALPPVSSAAGITPAPHQYSCLTCRSRKIKCDRAIVGCISCKKSHVPCVYASRRTQRSQKLQQVVTRRPLAPAVAGHAEELVAAGTSSSVQYRHCRKRDPLTPISCSNDNDNYGGDEDDDCDDLLVPREMRDRFFQSRQDIRQSDEGRLFVSQGKSRYINRLKSNQVATFERVLSAQQTGEEGDLSYTSLSSELLETADPDDGFNGSSLFNGSNLERDLRHYYPSTEIANLLWQSYVHNVDILVKIIYKPAVEVLIMSHTKDSNGIGASTEALLFAIYFASVTSLSSEECLNIHHEERGLLVRRYRYALEQALAKTGLLTSQEIEVLQAIILLLTFAPSKDTRLTWMLTGMAVRIAQAMGMRRDSMLLSLSTVDIEVRRRVWWALCLLDSRISEDCGLDCNIPTTTDTKPPLHVNDSDIDVAGTEILILRTGFSEMTISLIKIEVAEVGLKLKLWRDRTTPMCFEKMEKLVRDINIRYESTNFKYLDTSLHLHHLVDLGTRLMIAKLWRTVYNHSRSIRAPLGGEEVNERLLECNTEVVDMARQLPERSAKFGWFFCKYMLWHAIVFLFVELYNGNEGTAIDRAWSSGGSIWGF
ncbi:hypothetical protein OIDMADRAFT_32616 [Oidiodendron maius Zn]|uniref:Zn(2)-C6 fungal-type domain-containing protein n=1 Tax=Oidiodendron maius (strain Zn) TaxID=913774 RepID=A0A0C3GZX4_OIDMZ|nr:hypothetical protein OIDMADRAFT_32616 [Oidiodendron maius Zn]